MPRPALVIGGTCRRGHVIDGPEALVTHGQNPPRRRCRLCANRRPVTPRKLAGIKAWRVAHPERVRRYQRTYDDRVRTEPTLLDRHRARDRASAARQKALDPDGYTCQKAWKHARRRYGPRDYTFEQWVAVWSGSCFGCGLTPARGVDHIVGERSGGANALSNLQPACLHCNHSKARKVAA